MEEELKEQFIPEISRNGTKNLGVEDTKLLRKEMGYENKPDDISWGSWVQLQNPRMGIHSMVAYLMAGGMSTSEIAKQVGLSESRIHAYKHSELMQKEVRRIQERYAGPDLKKRFQTLSPKAVDVIESVLDDTGVKAAVRLQAATLILDHSIGRPQQNIEVGGSLLRQIFEKLDKAEIHQVIDLKEPEPQTVAPIETEVKPEPPKQEDFIDKWVSENL